MKYFSLFSGVEGFGQGFPPDWQAVGFSEIDKYASMVLKYHYGDLINKCSCDNILLCPLRFVTDVKYIEQLNAKISVGGVESVLIPMQQKDIEQTLKNTKKQFKNGKKETQTNSKKSQNEIISKDENSYLKNMEENVPAVEKQQVNFYLLTTEIMMDLGIEKNMEQGQCINSALKEGFQVLINSSVITVITQKQSIKYVHTKKYRKGVPNFGDIKSIDWKQVPDFDLLTGGSPCQDFSIAGKRKGLRGSRSSLAWEYIRCLRSKKPRYFIWENVKGVLSSNEGKDFECICEEFCKSGYAIDFEVLNAKNFGVPQNRERVFLIGKRLDLLDSADVI